MSSCFTAFSLLTASLSWKQQAAVAALVAEQNFLHLPGKANRKAQAKAAGGYNVSTQMLDASKQVLFWFMYVQRCK